MSGNSAKSKCSDLVMTSFHLLFETGQLKTDFSNLYYFLPSITDGSETISQHMKSVNLTLFDIPEKTFEVQDNLTFDPS